ncbi:hypothetical protein [Humibacter ginsenosidimutans]|uniref:GlsB/YeaQ/YmgE family stress response membrane protein n=1 Tax=Humibacter ginsenosidimutans TaxID=2599293 RepID=A0A5B8M0K6_9MICO|nr:hypothetical protein [Humibacter ginsenosidimutans]QDZ14358.1 hypothetical protein FPZ11_05905 [Humibacter ginsenosidimutans]
MELLFITLGGAIIGLIARYTLPYRHSHGAVLIPALGAGVAAAVWVILTWVGMKWDGGWIWWITLIVTAIVSVGVDLLLGGLRTRSDEQRLHRLTRTGVSATGA